MSNQRRMRRQARQVRRAGMQPMLMINSGDQFPEPAAVLVLRWLWRYRSELAPATSAACLLIAAIWAHAAIRQWWPVILSASTLAAFAVAAWTKSRIPALIERLYWATVTLAGGTWLATSATFGPFTRPLPLALGIGALVLAVPWWAHRRRRAKVAVTRKLEAWPDIARAVGLAGSEVISATVTLWGWRARLRLARGQTIADVTAKIPALESALGTYRNAVRVQPTPDDLANRCELRVLDRDPHADAVPWPGPSVTSITEPIGLGPFEDAEPCRVLFLRRHAIVGGATGSGKSGGLNELLGNFAACRDVVIWAIDLKRGMELRPWAPCIGRLATTPAEAAALLADAVTILFARAQWLADHGKREWEPTPTMPALVILIDEFAELADDAAEAMSDTDTIARLGRAPAVTLVAATQRPTQKVMGQGAVRSQMNIRIAYRVEEQRDVDLILGQGKLKAGWQAHKLNAPGKFLISSPEHDTPRRARAYLVTDDDVKNAVARYAASRPHLDSISGLALVSGPPSSGQPSPGEPSPGAGAAEPTINPDQPEQDAQEEPDALWQALCAAPGEGWDIGELMRITGWKRTKLYRHLREHAETGRAIQVSRGHWRARTTEEPSP